MEFINIVGLLKGLVDFADQVQIACLGLFHLRFVLALVSVTSWLRFLGKRYVVGENFFAWASILVQKGLIPLLNLLGMRMGNFTFPEQLSVIVSSVQRSTSEFTASCCLNSNDLTNLHGAFVAHGISPESKRNSFLSIIDQLNLLSNFGLPTF